MSLTKTLYICGMVRDKNVGIKTAELLLQIKAIKLQPQKSPEELYYFLTQVENFKHLLPEDAKFELLGDDKFLFGLKGMPEIKLALRESTPYSKVVLGSLGSNL